MQKPLFRGFLFYLYPTLLKQILHIVKLEWQLEWKRKSSIGSVLLYSFATIYTCYLAFKSLNHAATWNALFWLILLFAAINTIAKAFMLDSRGRQLYHYSLFKAESFLLGRILYNVLLMNIISWITLLFFMMFLGNLVQDIPSFLLVMFLGSSCFASILTLISSIASKTKGNLGIMAVLSFPMLLPALMTIMKASKNAVDGLDPSVSYSYWLILILLNIVVTALGFLLFPYLWRD
jgi:heme exporter protein B